MIIIENTAVSDDIADKFFVCNLQACKGACCVEGDAGAPLEQEELLILEDIYEDIKPFLSQAGINAISEKGLFEVDEDGDFCTTTVGNRECAYAVYDAVGILKCGIEQAYKAGKTTFTKPISCHLYPIRITKSAAYELLNYSRWHICAPACQHGTDLQVPLYKFLKDPLIRKYGTAWYDTLQKQIESDIDK